MTTYRAQKSVFNDSWNIERQYPCINGLSAWFQVAVVHEADEVEMGYTDGAFGLAEERANAIVDALNARHNLCDDEGCPHHGTDHVCINRVDKDCEVCGGDCAAANPPVMNCPRDDAKDALRLLWNEVVESGNADSKSYGWPKAAAATRKVLGL